MLDNCVRFRVFARQCLVHHARLSLPLGPVKLWSKATPQNRATTPWPPQQVSDRYFETLGAPIARRARFQHPRHIHIAEGAIVSKSMAQNTSAPRIHSGDISASGTGIHGRPIEIVGIVKDAKYGSLREEPSPFVFIPWSQGGAPGPLTSFELRVPAAFLPRSFRA